MTSLPLAAQYKIREANEHAVTNGMTPCVFELQLTGGLVRYGFNFRPLGSEVGDRFHYDYGVGIERNEDACVVWLKTQ